MSQDKKPPELLYCPGDVWALSKSNQTLVNFEEPQFIDDLKSIQIASENDLRSGQLYAPGEYRLTYIAADESGNTEKCSFHLYVLKEHCPMPSAPINGEKICHEWGVNSKFKVCRIQCNEKLAFAQPVPEFYACGAEGTWRPQSSMGDVFSQYLLNGVNGDNNALFTNNNNNNQLVFPACSPQYPAQRLFRMHVNFPSTVVCSESGKKILTSRIKENLLKIDQIWKMCNDERRASCHGLAVDVKCSKQEEPINREVQLVSFANNRFRRSNNNNNDFSSIETTDSTIDLNNNNVDSSSSSMPTGNNYVPVYLYSLEVQFPANRDPVLHANNQEKSTIDNIIQKSIYEQQMLSVKDILPNVNADLNSLQLITDYACPPGRIVKGSSCVECSIGTFYSQETKMCMPCPIGSYQNEIGQSQCKSCPIILTKSGTTSSIGARSVNECKPRCSAGKFYDESLGLCRSCGHGYYQPFEGKIN